MLDMNDIGYFLFMEDMEESDKKKKEQQRKDNVNKNITSGESESEQNKIE